MFSFSYYLLPVISGLFLSLPLAYPELFLISWVGLIPFLYILKTEKGVNIFWPGTVMGITIFIISTGWLYYPLILYSGLPAVIGLILFVLFIFLLGSIYGIWAILLSFIKRKSHISPFLLAISWIGIEYLRFLLIPDLAFGFTAYTQADFPWMLQLAEYGGFFLVGFIVILINGYIFLAVSRKRGKYLIPVILLLCVIMINGIIRIDVFNSKNFKQINTGIIQTHLSPSKKWKIEDIEKNMEFLINHSAEVDDNQLIIWPESALTFDLIRNEYYRERFFNLLETVDTNIQAGSLAIIENGLEKYNSSFLITAEGQINNRYNKIRLVPFGEYMPFNNIVKKITGISYNSEAPGDKSVTFSTAFARWRVLICSEILHPGLVQKKVEQVQFFVNQSNEGWYRKGSLQEQMWTAAKFRAVENRRSVVKAGNIAYGGVVSPTGMAVKKKHAAEGAVIEAGVSLLEARTLYQQWGDYTGYISAGILLLLLVIKWLYRRFV